MFRAQRAHYMKTVIAESHFSHVDGSGASEPRRQPHSKLPPGDGRRKQENIV